MDVEEGNALERRLPCPAYHPLAILLLFKPKSPRFNHDMQKRNGAIATCNTFGSYCKIGEGRKHRLRCRTRRQSSDRFLVTEFLNYAQDFFERHETSAVNQLVLVYGRG